MYTLAFTYGDLSSQRLFDLFGQVTPHVAAESFPEDVAATFARNLALYQQGLPMEHVVDWDRGY